VLPSRPVTLLSAAPARETTPPERSSARPRIATIVVFVVLACGLVSYFFTRSDLWLDEALSVNIARLPLGELENALRHDGAPPLYYALLHVWTGVLGTGDWAVRALSGVCMVGAAVALWFGGRRVAGAAGGWIAVIVVASNPYAIRYATETRMYALEILLVAWGILAFRRALERPTIGRLVPVGIVVVLLLYTQYWALYLVLVTFGLLIVMSLRGTLRQPARRMLLTMAIAGLAFIPWLSTFLYQRAHTGTPWGDPQLPGVPIGYTLRDFAGGDYHESWLLLVPLFAMLLLGLFGRATDDRHIEIDVRTQPGARWEAFVGGTTLVVGLVLTYIAGGAFESRYSAIVFPFYVLVVARGFTTLTDTRVRWGVLAVVVVLGFVGAGRNITTNRTQAEQAVEVLRAGARAGDLVVYCPDQLGPSVHRLAPGGLDEVTYPEFRRPAFVDWVDYKERLARVDPAVFARQAIARAGSHTLWLVTSPSYTTHGSICSNLSNALTAERTRHVRVGPDESIFEHLGVQEFPATPETRG
jgi:mannosyltransferase